MSEAAVTAATSKPAGLPEPKGMEWTWADLDALPDGGPKTEIVEGSLHVSPKPAHPHQYAALQLCLMLQEAAPSEWVVLPEVDLELGRNVYEPDVVVLAAAAYGARGPLAPASVVLAVEVTSPSSRSMDRIIKPAALAAAGVPNYWRVDLDGEPFLEIHELAGATYRLVQTLRAGTATRLERPFPVQIDPALLVRSSG